MQQVERLRHGDVFVGVMQCIDEHLGLALFERDVVADLGGVELAALVALPNREDINDLRMRGLYRKDLAADLFVGLKRTGPQIRCLGSRRCASQHRANHEGNQDASVAGHHLQYAPSTNTGELAARRSPHAQPNTRHSRYRRKDHERHAPG